VAKIDWQAIDGTVATVERRDGRGGPTFTVVFTYVVNGHWCAGTFTSGQEYRVGDTLAVQYDPNNPDHNDLSDKEARKKWLTVIIVISVFGLFLSMRAC
jgi:hypothetical protein